MTTLEVQEIHKAVANLRIYPATRDRLKILAFHEGVTMSEMVHQLVEERANSRPKEES